MVTQYGKILRKIRIDEGELLGDMADKLMISSSYLSAIETGNREIPINFTRQITEMYRLKKAIVSQLEKAEIENIKVVKMLLNEAESKIKKETAVIFARTFKNMRDEDIEQIRAILIKKEDKK